VRRLVDGSSSGSADTSGVVIGIKPQEAAGGASDDFGREALPVADLNAARAK
jgi:hypothetical protein